MKTYNITNRLSAQAKREISRIINTHEKYTKAYFWKPNQSADSRRRAERLFEKSNPDVAFINGDNKIEVYMTYEESCKNCYYNCSIYLNGSKKSISLIKKLLH